MPIALNHQLRYGGAAEAGMSADRIQNIRRLGAEWVKRGEAASLTMLVARRGVVVLHEAYGRLGPEPGAPALPRDALYPLASATKPITATCVMCLVEDGVLGLNRPIQQYVPEFTGEGKDAVMVHHLLTHTSGITPECVEAHAATKLEGAASATATAWDMAMFAQMFLNHGMYGDVRVLSGASIAEMTRDQIPGIGAVYGAERFKQAGWGYGWGIQLNKKAVNFASLASPRMFEHGGAGGTSVLVDPQFELAVVYFSIETSAELGGVHQWHLDHVVNAAIAAIES